MRTDMPDNSQLFEALHYKADSNSNIDLVNDIPTPFMFEWVDDTRDEQNIVVNRITKTSSAIIKTDYENLAQQDIVVINGDEYNVSNINTIHNGSFDLRAVRGITNKSYLVELDT